VPLITLATPMAVTQINPSLHLKTWQHNRQSARGAFNLSPADRGTWSGRAAFSLVELLAVVVVILALAGVMLGITGYVRKRVALSTAKSQIAAISIALEMYKADIGYYPRTGVIRISASSACESTNNNLLYRALSGTCLNCSKVYLKFPEGMIQSNFLTGLLNIMDPYSWPYNYYCSPSTSLLVSNVVCDNCNLGFVIGGQVNVATFDLFSYGMDKNTYVSGAGTCWGVGQNWLNPNSAADDITNWKR